MAHRLAALPRRLIVGFGAAVLLGGLDAGSSVSAVPGSVGASGTWAVSVTGEVDPITPDSYTFVRKGNSDTYEVTNEYGFSAVASVPPSGGSVTLDFSVAGSKTSDHFIEHLTFKFPATGNATFSGTYVQRTYDGSPGYHGTITGARAGGPPAGVSLTVVVSASSEKVGVGKTVSVTASVAASGGAVSAVSLGPGLVSSGAAALVTSSPSGLSGFLLAGGASRSFVFKVKGAKAGTVTLSVSASGTAASGAVQGSGQAQLEVTAAGISGTVYAVSCGESTCSQKGLPGLTVLVTGKTSDGGAVAETDRSGSDGSWSVKVPSGSYTAGPTLDGSTFAGPVFDPEKKVDLSANASGVDFRVCAGATGAAGPASSVSHGVRAPAGVASAAGASFGPSLCKSQYTVSVSAAIPLRMMVDPSPQARYHINNFSAGYNDEVHWISAAVHNNTLRRLLLLDPEYPNCFDDPQVEELTKNHVNVEWYSYIRPGSSLGKVNVPVAWNQGTKEAYVVQAPTEQTYSMTRVFEYRYTLDGHTTTGQCQETNEVPMVYMAVAGGDGAAGAAGRLAPNEFTIIAAWAFPFVGPGKLAPEAHGIGAYLAGLAGGLGAAVYEKYESLSAPTRALIDLVAAVLLTKGFTTALEAAPGVMANFAKGARSLEHWFAGAASVIELHHLAGIPGEAAGILTGFMAAGYPVMAAVVRGKFHTEFQPYTLPNGTKFVKTTTLALSAMSTRFPSVKVTVARNAYPNPDSSKGVKQGLLPWHTALFSDPVRTQNGTFGNNPPFLISNIASNGHNYSSGSAAVQSVLEDTSQTPAVSDSMKEAELASGFAAEQAEAPDPACTISSDDVPRASSDRTICWLFKDGRP